MVWTGQAMDLRTETEIDGKPGSVWSVLTDFTSFPIWNPFIANAQGELVPGAELRITLSLFDGSELRLRPRVEVVKVDRELRWKACRWFPSWLTLEHWFLLEPRPNERTRLVHGQTVSGRLQKYLGPDITLAMRGMVQMNLVLKQRVEQVASG
jgi:hypothetical protein